MVMAAKCVNQQYVPVDRINEYQICKNKDTEMYFIVFFTDYDGERQSYDEFETYSYAEEHIRFLLME